MAKQIEGVYEAVLACAKKEFLEKDIRTLPFGPSPRRQAPAPAPFIPALRTRKVCSRPLLGLPPPR